MKYNFTNKAEAYASALDSDISTEPFKQVRNSILWRGYVGTIYGAIVGTDAGYAFKSRHEALENAKLMREQCRDIVARKG